MLTIDIVTPTRKLVEGAQVESVKIPGARGELQILDGHTELITLLKTGSVSFVQDGRERRFALSHGFAEVRKNKVLVLADTVEDAPGIDKTRAQAAQRKAEQALLGVLTESDFKKQQLKLERAIVRQHVSGSN